MAKLLYKPFGIIAGIIAGRLAGTLFEKIWKLFDRSGDLPPTPTQRDAPGGKAVAANAVRAATFAGTRTAVDRASLRGFHYLTGLWAGDKPLKNVGEDSAAEAAER